VSDPSLKCVVVHSPRRNLCTIIENVLAEHVPEGELIGAGDDAYVVHTAASTAEVRDWLRDALEPDERAFVFEFETWSGLGPLNGEWLMRRGH